MKLGVRFFAAGFAALLAGAAVAAPRHAAKKAEESRGLGSGGFKLDTLPPGKNVTIPRPATTLVPLAGRVVFTATDMPQSLSFRPVNLQAGSLRTLRLSIYDSGAARVQYVNLTPGTPFLYNFKDLTPITVITQEVPGAAAGLALQVESDKPLEIAH